MVNAPGVKVIVDDAYRYVLEHYNDYDFIQASPPCISHSRTNAKFRRPRDMRLWLLIDFLFRSQKDFIVENVITHYTPPFEPFRLGRHFFWSNLRLVTQEVKPYSKEIEKMSIKDFERHYNLMAKPGRPLDQRQSLRNVCYFEIKMLMKQYLNPLQSCLDQFPDLLQEVEL